MNLHIKNFIRRFRPSRATLRQYVACLAAALLVLTLFPVGAHATLAYISTGDISETDITIGNATLIITLDTNTWALGSGNVKTAKCNALLDAMYADSQSEQWNKVRDALKNQPDKFSESGQTLTIELPKVSDYDITYDQTITVNIPSSLLGNSSDTVSIPLSFTIKAKPEAFISGNIIDATEDDIISGGRKIVITLNSGTWQDVVNDTAKREALFDHLKTSSEADEWDKVLYTLKADEPFRTISLSGDGKTITITLPPVPDYNISAAQTIELDTSDALSSLVTTPVKDSQPSFCILPSSTAAQLTGTAVSATEGSIRAGGNTIVISLADNTWASDIVSVKAKRDALFDNMIARSEQSEWAKVINTLKNAPNAITLSDEKTLTITLPAVSNYNISSNQTININIPATLLANNYRLNTMTFTIKADLAASISGTIVSADETDIIAGSKTIIISLTNAKWANDIAVSLEKRQALIDKFTALGSDAAEWDKVKDALKATGNFKRNSDTKLTITLPPVSDFNISSTMAIDFSGIDSSDSLVYDDAGTPVSIPALNNAFTIKAVTGQTATISGNILSKATELDIAKGGKTITIALKDDVWVPDITSKSAQLLAGFTVVSGSAADKAAWNSAISAANVSLSNPNTVNITLPPVPSFNITDDITVQLTIDKSLLTTTNMAITASPSFTIYAVTANLSGTALTGSLDAPAVEKGGKTIIITLNNASWIPTAVSDITNLNSLLNGFNGSAWTPIKDKLLENPKNITMRGNQITIKLPPVPGYKASGVISMTVPKGLVSGANNDITATPNITIGAATSATLSTGWLSENDIVSGGRTISITLANNKWTDEMVSNKQKVSALIDGFSASTQADQWKLVQSAVKAADPAHIINLSADKATLTLTLPATADYDILKDQSISVTISKSLLSTSNADINAGSFTIMSAKPSSTLNFEDALNDGTLAGWLDSVSPRNIYVIVPEKHIFSIDITYSELGSSYITDINITADSSVASIAITSGSIDRVISTYTSSGDKRVFTTAFTDLIAGSDITISALDSSGNNLQKDIVKKVVNGKNTYSEMPKTELNGSYTLHNLLTNSKLLDSILQYYSLSELLAGIN